MRLIFAANLHGWRAGGSFPAKEKADLKSTQPRPPIQLRFCCPLKPQPASTTSSATIRYIASIKQTYIVYYMDLCMQKRFFSSLAAVYVYLTLRFNFLTVVNG